MLHIETPGWRVLVFQCRPLVQGELEQQRDKIRKNFLVVRDREHPFTEDLIVDGAGVTDSNLHFCEVFCAGVAIWKELPSLKIGFPSSLSLLETSTWKSLGTAMKSL